MPRYRYKAATPGGEVLEGEIEGADRSAAIARIQAWGQIPIRVAPAGRERPRLRLGGLRGRDVSARQVAALVQELSSLLRAGLPLDRSLQLALEVTRDPRTRALIGRLHEAIKAGGSLSQAMEREPGAFSALHVSMVRAAEASGDLGAGLERLAEYLERLRALRERVLTALVYPGVLTAVAGASLLVILVYVLPKVTALFGDAGAALPLSTRVLVGAADLLSAYGWLLVLLALGAAVLVRRAFAHPGVRMRWDRAALRAPLAGDLVRKLETARFSRSMGTLIANGVPVPSALSLARGTLANRALARALEEAAEPLKSGRGLAGPLAAQGLLPALAVQMIKVGEETGQLDAMLLRVADVYDRETAAAIQRLVGLLEPVLIVGLGVLIGGIIMSILAAIVSVNDLPI